MVEIRTAEQLSAFGQALGVGSLFAEYAAAIEQGALRAWEVVVDDRSFLAVVDPLTLNRPLPVWGFEAKTTNSSLEEIVDQARSSLR